MSASEVAVPEGAAPLVLVVAGEASSDLHAAQVMKALSRRVPGVRFVGMGGVNCVEAGLERWVDARDTAVMGIVEVIPALPRILRAMSRLARGAKERQPQVALLCDLPDFNLRMAPRLKRLGIKVAYFISPTVWAWRKGRIATIRAYVDRMLCILPFEEAFYRREGVEARYVGNPTLEELGPPVEVEAARRELGLDPAARWVALLPGSRRGELSRVFPTELAAAARLSARIPGLQFVVPVAPTLDAPALQAHADAAGVKVTLIAGRAPLAVAASEAAIVCSGTAALEAGLMLRPMVVVYRVAALTYWIARALVNVAHVSLVNLLAGRRVVPELLQHDFTAERTATEIERLLNEPAAREAQLEGLRAIRATLGEPGAAERAAEELQRLLGR